MRSHMANCNRFVDALLNQFDYRKFNKMNIYPYPFVQLLLFSLEVSHKYGTQLIFCESFIRETTMILRQVYFFFENYAFSHQQNI